MLEEEGPDQNLKLSSDSALNMIRGFVRDMAQPIDPAKAQASIVQFTVTEPPAKKGKKRAR